MRNITRSDGWPQRPAALRHQKTGREILAPVTTAPLSTVTVFSLTSLDDCAEPALRAAVDLTGFRRPAMDALLPSLPPYYSCSRTMAFFTPP